MFICGSMKTVSGIMFSEQTADFMPSILSCIGKLLNCNYRLLFYVPSTQSLLNSSKFVFKLESNNLHLFLWSSYVLNKIFVYLQSIPFRFLFSHCLTRCRTVSKNTPNNKFMPWSDDKLKPKCLDSLFIILEIVREMMLTVLVTVSQTSPSLSVKICV